MQTLSVFRLLFGCNKYEKQAHQNHLFKMNQSEIPVGALVRVSTKKQDYQRQIEEIQTFAASNNWRITKTIASKLSGVKELNKRTDIQELKESVIRKEFKKLIVLETNRLGRIAKEIRATIDFLHSHNVSVVFKNLGGIESLSDGKESFVTNVIIAIYAELAQEERRILIERIESGLEQAKRNGKILGRRAGSNESESDFLKKYTKLAKDIKNNISLSKCVKIHQVSKNTVLKVKRLITKTIIS